MSYIPNPNDNTQPLDTTDRSTAAAEFRSFKTYLNTISTVASSAAPDIFNAASTVINYTGTAVATGFVAALNAGEHTRTVICAGAAQFTAGANLVIDGIPSGQTLTVTPGTILLVFATATNAFRITQLSPLPIFITGTKVAFYNAAAPLGWTAIAANDDSVIRLNSATAGTQGGAQAFSTWNGLAATGAHTLAVSEIPTGLFSLNDPGHVHGGVVAYPGGQNFASGNPPAGNPGGNTASAVTGIWLTDHGGNGSHTHSLTHNIKYSDFLLCSKN